VVGLWWRRRDDIRRAHAYGFERIFAGATMTLLEVRVRPLGDAAVVHGRWELVGQRGPDGSAGSRRRGVLVVVGQRTPAGWVAVTAQNTDRLPGTETVLVRDGAARAVTYR
jgi:ketosteroid isomerase-like protein